MHEPAILLTRLIACCGDPDPSTRKFACFAVGNAAFHSNVLYPNLVDAIPLLITAMKDPDEKTRANANGALGNLARNSSELCPALMHHQVAQHLLDAAMHDSAAAPRRIALFSLGTLSVYARCRHSIEQLVPSLLDCLSDIEHETRSSPDVDQQVRHREGKIS